MAIQGMAATTGGGDRLAEVLATLERGIAALLTSDGFAAYLRAMARFPTYSARNIALINAQCPNASRVAGYRAWQALGRQVRRGERGIRILAPYRRVVAPADGGGAAEDDHAMTAIAGFGVATVFDIAQTDGAPLPAPTAPRLLADDSPVAGWLWDGLAAFLAAEAVPLDRRPLAQGYGVYFPVIRRVAVHVALDGDQAAKTLAHECAHHVALTRAIGRHEASRADAETIAEGAAFAVLARYGLDAGVYSFPYVAAQEDHAVALRGPARPDYQWQARARNGFALDACQLDWAREQATCPANRTSISWRQRPDPAGRNLIWVKFSSKDCGPCPSRPACCRAQGRSPRRTLCLRPRAQFEALRVARQRESTAARGETYARRAGIAGTLARGIRRCRLRRTRYRGQPQVQLGHILAATGLNFLRLGEWFAGTPRRHSRRSPFAHLLAAPRAA